jgi:hypothetical protein
MYNVIKYIIMGRDVIMKLKKALVDSAVNNFKEKYEAFIEEKLDDNMTLDEIEKLSYEFIQEENNKVFQTIVEHVDTVEKEDKLPCKCGKHLVRHQCNVEKKKNNIRDN